MKLAISGIGTSRHIAAGQYFGRFRGEADIAAGPPKMLKDVANAGVGVDACLVPPMVGRPCSVEGVI